MKDHEKRIEAILFAVGKEISSERIASLCSLDVPHVEETLGKLQQEYAQRDHSLQLLKKENGWKLTVRDEFVPLVSTLVASTEVERPLMETLAIIALKYPILQAYVIKLRGAVAYDHMRELEARGYVEKERFGRSYKIKLTKKFFEYFDLPSEEAKQAFLKHVPPETLQEAEQVSKETDEVERLIDLEQKELIGKEEIKHAVDHIRKEE